MNRVNPEHVDRHGRALLEALARRQDASPTIARAGLLEELTTYLEQGPESGRPPELVTLIEGSSLGTPMAAELRSRTAPEIVTTVLDIAARRRPTAGSPNTSPTEGIAVNVVGPIAEWMRELWRLREDSGMENDKLLSELQGLGLLVTWSSLADALDAMPLSADRELVRSIVTILGGDWSGRGYEASFEAARDEQSRLQGAVPVVGAREEVSGLAGADALTPSTLARQVHAPYDRLPGRVRGRQDLLDDLVSALDTPSGPVRVLVGGGGAGKSTLALAVATEARDRGHSVWWVAASDPNQVTRGLLAIATQLGSPIAEMNAIQDAPDVGAALLSRRLESSPTRWLIVFDDADVDVLGGLAARDSWLMGGTTGTTLITSRVTRPLAWPDDAIMVPVPDLDDEAGALVLLDQMATDSATGVAELVDARRVARRLGGVALALRTIGTYLDSSFARHRIDEVLSSVDIADPPDAADETRPPGGRLSATWTVTIQALAASGVTLAPTVMAILSHYASNWVVPDDVLDPDRLASLELGVTTSSEGWRLALQALCEVGLLERKRTAGEGVSGFVLHPQVADACKANPSTDVPEADLVEAAAVELLLSESAGLDAGLPRCWPALRRLEPHVYALLDSLRTPRPDVRAAALHLANRVAGGLIKTGLFALGETLIRQAKIKVGRFRGDRVESLAADHTLAWALGLRGELLQSERRLRAVLLRHQQLHGVEHPDALHVRDHLAWVMAESGRLEEAHEQFAVLLPAFVDVFGAHHPATLAVRHRMAWIAGLRGDPRRAEAELREILPLRTAALGADHMEVLSSRYRLGWALGLQGCYADAEAHFTTLLHDVDRVYDPDAPAVVMVRARLGWVRTWQGRFEEALQDSRYVLRTRERILGMQHPRTLRARHDLAWTLHQSGDDRRAEQNFREVLSEVERSKQLGRNHPLALDSRGRLTRVLADSGRLDEAERCARALISTRVKVSGPDHPATFTTRFLLALTLSHRGRLPEAQQRLEELIDDEAGVIGRDHRLTLEARSLLAEIRGRRGRLRVAQDELAEVYDARLRLLDRTHPHTMNTAEQLVWVLGEAENLHEAEQQCLVLVQDTRSTFGAGHPAALAARYRLAWLFGLASRGEEAERMFRALHVDQHRVLGREHPHTLRTRHGHAREMVRTGQPDHAVEELRGVLLDRIHILGRSHPDTLNNRHTLALALAMQGHVEEAEHSLDSLLIEQTAALGAGHRDTLATRERRIWLRMRMGFSASPRAEWEVLLSDQERFLDDRHPAAVRTRTRLAGDTFEVPWLW